jgi:NNP family nitrate/nitrite transporter-like MFS transporter
VHIGIRRNIRGPRSGLLARLFAPARAVAFGWSNVLGLAVLPLAAVFLFFLFVAKDSPKSPPPKFMADYARLLRNADRAGCSSIA